MQNKTINGFTLQRLLGTGGMAEVWYAENEIGMKAAVKILSEELSHNAQMQERFLNEAKVMVKLDHPNIRKVHGYGEMDGRPAIVMEYLDGSDLKARMKQGQHFTDEELQRWWNQMVDALNYTHAQNIVHRDIKPSNIFIDQKGNAKLLDFGIAKVTDTTTGTLTGSTLGTRIYMSPEQVRDPKRVGTASDAYSLAVSFVHLLTGKAPYDSTTSSDYDIQVNIVTKPVDMSNVSAEWQNFLTPYLIKEADNRPALRHFEMMPLEEKGIKKKYDDETVTDEPKPQTEAQPSTKDCHSGLDPLSPALNDKLIDNPKSKKGLWIGLGIAAAAVVALLVLLLKPKQEPTSTNPDTQAYEACQTVADYRAYLSDYGRNALHYSDAKAFVEQYVADSVKRAQDSLAQVQVRQMAQQQAESEMKAQTEAEKKEDAAYQKCNTIAACDSSLIDYPQGRYVDEVRAKKAKLEKEQLKTDLQNTGETPEQCFNNGVDYYNSKNYKEAVKWYRKSADQGYANAQCNLGYMYEVGRGVSQSYSEAVKWYRSAAEQGAAQAQCNLGYMYEFGRGVTQSYSEAEKWYRKAADQGHSKAQFNLAVLYWGGLGVSQNDSEAVKWYRKSADQGYASAQCNLGYMYEVGRGVTQSYTEAVKWYRSAAEQGESQAQCNLGCMYEFGRGVTQSYSEAVKWYRKAAEQGHSRAQYNLGVLYNNGSGVSQDKVEAKKWISKAAAQGFQDAVEFLNNVNF